MSLLLLVIMCCVYGLNADPQGMLFYLFLALCLYTIYHELTQATTMRVEAFATNLILSLVSVAGVSILITIMMRDGTILYPYALLGAAVILLDAIVSPIIAFKMALRNIAVTGSSGEF